MHRRLILKRPAIVTFCNSQQRPITSCMKYKAKLQALAMFFLWSFSGTIVAVI